MSRGNKDRDKVELFLYAKELKNVAGAFKGTSDPFAVVTRLGTDHEESVILGKTEVIKNSLNPVWTKTVFTTYTFGRPVYVNVGIWDEVRKSSKDKPMGSATFEIGDVLGTRGNVKAKRLKHGGVLFLRIQRDLSSRSLVISNVSGKKLANVEGGLFGKSDPFFEIASESDGAGGKHWNTIYRSKHIKDNLNPIWSDRFSIDMDKLRQDDNKSTSDPVEECKSAVRFTIYDHEKSGKHEFMGSFETTVGDLLGSQTAFQVKSKKGKPAGVIVIGHATIIDEKGSSDFAGAHTDDQHASGLSPSRIEPLHQRRPTFLDYISGSCELNMSVAIDFTGSNGDPRRPGTLHYIHPDGIQLNDYEKAITAIGSIISKYDSDQRYSVYGFGAKFHGRLYHCFPCSDNNNAEVAGVGGILRAYRQIFNTQITLSGPTLFEEVIKKAASTAVSAQENAQRMRRQAYSVLLIITDGAVSDVNATKHALMEVSNAPLSVVIIGVGNADFSAMQFLDDFKCSSPNYRDVAQFVEFRRFAHDKRALTEATLEEIPDQLVEYFLSRNIYPSPAMQSDVVPVPYNEDVDIDLNMNFHTSQNINGDDIEIDLTASSNGFSTGLYDPAAYGTATQYLQSEEAVVLPPPFNPSSSAAPSSLHASSVSPPHLHTSFSPSRLHASAPTSPPSSPPFNPNYSPPPSMRMSGGDNNGNVVPMALPLSQQQHQPSSSYRQQSGVFRIQVPHGVVAGQQLQVQNPHNGQMVLVTVPPGVGPGQMFDAR